LSVVVAGALVGVVQAGAPLAATGPTITSDQKTYTAGATVTLKGKNWKAGDAVQIVTTIVGKPFTHRDVAAVAADGTFTSTLTLPKDVVASFNVAAAGKSGFARTSFSTQSTAPSQSPGVGAQDPSPTGAAIASDQPDYLPGATVTLTGTHWAAFEAVHIHVD